MIQVSNIELNRLIQDADTKMYIDFELPPKNMYVRKNEVIILDVNNEQYTLHREDFLNDVVIWWHNNSMISLKNLSARLEKMYSELG
jgi:hypothetical protein